jgi:hypothetical protein
MIREPYFSNSPAWMESTPAIRALHQKEVVIRRGPDSDVWLLTVEEADSKGSLAGRCAVRATHAGSSPTMRTVMKESEAPQEPTRWIQEEYLLPGTLLLLCSEPGNAESALTLQLPDTE